MKIKKTPSEIRYERELKAYYKQKLKGKKKKAKRKVAKKNTKVNYAAMPYHEYLKSDYWKEVRQAVLKRDNNRCVICKRTWRLEIHHDSYKHRGNELKHLDDVMTLCSSCHEAHHYAQK